MRRIDTYQSDDGQFESHDSDKVLAYEYEAAIQPSVEQYVDTLEGINTRRGRRSAINSLMEWERWKVQQALPELDKQSTATDANQAWPTERDEQPAPRNPTLNAAANDKPDPEATTVTPTVVKPKAPAAQSQPGRTLKVVPRATGKTQGDDTNVTVSYAAKDALTDGDTPGGAA